MGLLQMFRVKLVYAPGFDLKHLKIAKEGIG